uniref:EF-hand domain-containing protein n=1 Tax=Hucho hucho TaxID=62062 RepID=A0A4W5Q204_9TELE
MNSDFQHLDAVGFLEIWQHFDADDNGYIEGKELDHFFRHMMTKLGPEVSTHLSPLLSCIYFISGLITRNKSEAQQVHFVYLRVTARN